MPGTNIIRSALSIILFYSIGSISLASNPQNSLPCLLKESDLVVIAKVTACDRGQEADIACLNIIETLRGEIKKE